MSCLGLDSNFSMYAIDDIFVLTRTIERRHLKGVLHFQLETKYTKDKLLIATGAFDTSY